MTTLHARSVDRPTIVRFVKELETAYREDNADNAELAAEWEPADAEVEE